mgnify:CR=1 FL=1|jgi:hypothetical protein
MDIERFYKGLPYENEIFGFTLEASTAASKGTMYEAWFDLLKASPWYARMASGDYLNQSAKNTWDGFGDLSNLTFSDWWKLRGHEIFAEAVPYRKVEEIDLNYKIKTTKGENAIPVLHLEVPLNLHPDALKQQFGEILRRQEALYRSDRFNRWDHSRADFHLQRDGKLDYSDIKFRLDLYAEYQAEKIKPGFQKNTFAQKKGLVKHIRPNDVLTNQYTKELNDSLDHLIEQTLSLMAHATEGHFPETYTHPWVKEFKREN